MGSAWHFPFIALAGVLQAAGAAMNGALNKSLVNPWLATAVSFLLVPFVASALFVVMPRPLPTVGDLADMPWWAPLGGIARHAINPWRLPGAVPMIAGVTLIAKF